jgi:peptidoglycan hydrolase-like protein with peptidoglycan-binding domain
MYSNLVAMNSPFQSFAEDTAESTEITDNLDVKSPFVDSPSKTNETEYLNDNEYESIQEYEPEHENDYGNDNEQEHNRRLFRSNSYKHEHEYENDMYNNETEEDVLTEMEFPAIYPATPGLSPFAIQTKKQWKRSSYEFRPKGWQGKVYGLVVHTTGGSLPGKAVKGGIYPTIYAINYYSQSSGCNYINGWKGIEGGDLAQVANESKEAWGVSMTEQKKSVGNNRFEKDLPAIVSTLWKKRWPTYQNPMKLLPGTQTANACYIHVECLPVVYIVDGKYVTDKNHPPMRPGLRFTREQHNTVAVLAYDIALRNGWPMDQPWWKTPRLLGHEDLAPIDRYDKNGGWDPGGLRDAPFFDWDYVYTRIQEIHKNGYKSVLPSPIRIAKVLEGAYSNHSSLFEGAVVNTVAPLKASEAPGTPPSPPSPLSTATIITDTIRNWGDATYISAQLEKIVRANLSVSLSLPFANMSKPQQAAFKTEWTKIRSDLLRGRKTLISLGFKPSLGTAKIPFGFEATIYNNIRGLKTGQYLVTDSVDKVLVGLHKSGKLAISQEELDLFQRIANVETSGRIQVLNTYDAGIVSIGFMQFTLHVGKIQEWIKLNEPAFKRFGIELDPVNKYKIGNSEVPAIKGVTQANINDLRWNGWAERFFYAGLDEEIIIAGVKLSKTYLAKHLSSLRSRLTDDTVYNTFINNYYNKSVYVKAMFQECHNNNPSISTRAVQTAVKAFSAPTSIPDFVKKYSSVLIAEGKDRIVNNTARGTALRLGSPVVQPELEDVYEIQYAENEGLQAFETKEHNGHNRNGYNMESAFPAYADFKAGQDEVYPGGNSELALVEEPQFFGELRFNDFISFPFFPVPPVPQRDWCGIRAQVTYILGQAQLDWFNPWKPAPNGHQIPEGERMADGSFRMIAHLEEYWKAVRGAGAPIPNYKVANPAVNARNSALNNEAWSAAFISWAMQLAGVLESDGFIFSRRHIVYIVQALSNARKNDQQRPVHLLAASTSVHAGDIMCFNVPAGNSSTNYSLADLAAQHLDGQNNVINLANVFGASHCDVVKEIINDGARRFAIVVGGNKGIPGGGPDGVTVDERRIEVNRQNVVINPAGVRNPGSLFGIIKLGVCNPVQNEAESFTGVDETSDAFEALDSNYEKHFGLEVKDSDFEMNYKSQSTGSDFEATDSHFETTGSDFERKEAGFADAESEPGFDKTAWSDEIISEIIASEDEMSGQSEQLTSSWSKAIEQNRYYSNTLGWSAQISQINKFLLPLSGQQNVTLSEEAFAQAAAAWQQQNGLTADGVIGPNTWSVMKPMLSAPASYIPVPSIPSGSVAPPVQQVLAFNQWHAQRILDSVSAGIVGVTTGLTTDTKAQLESLAQGKHVLNVNPASQIVQSLPVIYHICEQARQQQYRDIMIGSFIRPPKDGSCTGHCAGRCIDINYKGGSFSNSGAVQMVINILTYLKALPVAYKKGLGFGLPLQGDFFGSKKLPLFSSVPPTNLIDPRLAPLISALGIVFPDNPNHLHIQLKWM